MKKYAKFIVLIVSLIFLVGAISTMPPLRLEELDGDPSIPLTTRIRVSNGVLTRTGSTGTLNIPVIDILLVSPSSAYTTITLAMAAAAAGDTILVSDGTYDEVVTFSQNNLTLESIGGASNTIITQASGTTVDFSTMHGCMVEGFTIAMTAATTTNDEVIRSEHADASAYNTVQDCTITSTNDLGDAFSLYGIRIVDGDFKLINNVITVTQQDDHAVYAVFNTAVDTSYYQGNTITVDQDSVASSLTIAFYNTAGAGSVMHCNDNIITVDSTHTGASYGYAIYAGSRINHVSGNTINAYTSGSGAMAGLYTGAGDTAYYTANEIYVTTGDGDGEWANFSTGTSYITGSNVTGDGVLTTGGTVYYEGNLVNGVFLISSIQVPSYAHFANADAAYNDTTTPHVLIAAETKNTIITNGGAGEDRVYTSLAAVFGMNFMVQVIAGHQMDLEPDGTERLWLNGNLMAAGEHIINAADTKGDVMSCWSVETADGVYEIFCKSDNANWAEATP